MTNIVSNGKLLLSCDIELNPGPMHTGNRQEGTVQVTPYVLLESRLQGLGLRPGCWW